MTDNSNSAISRGMIQQVVKLWNLEMRAHETAEGAQDFKYWHSWHSKVVNAYRRRAAYLFLIYARLLNTRVRVCKWDKDSKIKRAILIDKCELWV